MTPRDVIIIGAGQNSLVAAFYLARTGLKPLVLERRSEVGGLSSTIEFHPGFRASLLEGAAGPLPYKIVSDMRLAVSSSQLLEGGECRLCVLGPADRALLLSADVRAAAKRIEAFSAKDAAKYLELSDALASARSLMRDLLLMTPPDIEHPSSRDVWSLLGAGRAFRKLGRRNMQTLLRWGPIAVADFAAEFFETELLRAAVASRGIVGAAAGPWSAGTTTLFLLRCVETGFPDALAWFMRGGAGALSRAMAAAAEKAGAEIRMNAEVVQVRVKDGAATGVVLANGEEISARAVVSGADPKRTFLQFVDPVNLAPSFAMKVRNYRAQGTVARLFFALDAAPEFTALKTLPEEVRRDALAGRIVIAPEVDYIERAFDASKYGEISGAPYLEITVPSLTDDSLAPAGRHVMAVHMQYAPFNVWSVTRNARGSSSSCHSESPRSVRGEESAFAAGSDSSSLANSENWAARRDELAEIVVKTIAQYAPNFASHILTRHVITPADFENDYGATGGHIFHGELALDQLFVARPILGFARYATPIRGLFLCGRGTHPGIGFAGACGFNAARQIAKSIRS